MSDVQIRPFCEGVIKVLVIEDDAETGLALVEQLERSGLRTLWARTGVEGLAFREAFSPDVVLVDLSLPDSNGMDIVTFLAREGKYGVIIVSGVGDQADRIVGLELGADDYIAKPPHLRELLARIRAVHRRAMLRTSIPPSAARSIFKLGKVTVNISSGSAYDSKGEYIKLTAAEFTVLKKLLLAEGEIVSRAELSEAALRRPWSFENRSVDQLVFNLRHKLAASDCKQLIYSVRGAGYRIPVEPLVMPESNVISLPNGPVPYQTNS